MKNKTFYKQSQVPNNVDFHYALNQDFVNNKDYVFFTEINNGDENALFVIIKGDGVYSWVSYDEEWEKVNSEFAPKKSQGEITHLMNM